MVELADTALFGGLRPVELARLVGELEELSLAPGAAVFRQGEPGDRLYLVREGLAEARAGDAAGGEPIAIYQPGDSFGESALLTEEPRSSTVVALTQLELWALRKQRFLELVEQLPGLALAVGRAVSRRLQATHQAVGGLHVAFSAEAEALLATLDPELQRFLRRTAPLDPVPSTLVARALGRSDAEQVLAYLAARLPLVTPAGPGVYRYHPLFREHLRARLREDGQAAEADWLRHLADEAIALGMVSQAARLLAESGATGQALALLEQEARRRLAEGDAASAESLLREAPAELLEAPALRELRADLLASQGELDQAIDLLEQAVHGDGAEPPGERSGLQARRYRRLAELNVQAGRQREALHWLHLSGETGAWQQGEAIEQLAPAGDERGEGAVARGLLAVAAFAGLRRAGGSAGALGWVGRSRTIGLLLAVGLMLAVLLIGPPAGLSQPAWLALGILAAALPLLVFSVLADHFVALLMIAGWAGLNLVQPRVALAGFSTPGWFLVLSVLAVGVALARAGLLYRIVLAILQRAPGSQVALSLSLALTGVLFSPAMPNATARTALVAPLVLELGEALGFRRRGRGSAALAMAVLLGFGQMCGLFLTGSSSGLLVHGLLPPESRARFGFVTWFLAALPLHLVLFVLTYLAIVVVLRPERVGGQLRGRIEAQRRVLGPMSRAEWIAAGVFLALLVAFVLGPLIGLEPAWAAVLAMVVLGATGVLDGQGFRAGINWSFLLFFGAMLSLAEVFSTLKVDAWLASAAAAPLTPLAGTPALFLLAVGLVGYLINLVVRWQAACLLMTLVLVPATQPLGFEPWVIGMTALVTTNMWFLPYQSTIYQALYYGTDEQAFTHQQARPIALLYGLILLVALVATVPIWRLMGLVP